MLIDLNKDPQKIELKEMHYVNNYFGRLFKEFFKMNDFEADNNFAEKDGVVFDYSYHTPGFQIQANDIKDGKFIYPMRYYDYPCIDDDFGFVTWAPNQGWMLGFAEKLLASLNKHLLKIIESKDVAYAMLVKDSKEKFECEKKGSWHPGETALTISEIKKKNLLKVMTPAFLNFERNSSKELKEDIQRLLSCQQ